MRQRVTQAIRILRKQRHSSLRRIANEASRRDTQRLTRIVSMPLLIVSSLTILYLLSQFAYVLYQERSFASVPTAIPTTIAVAPTATVTSTPEAMDLRSTDQVPTASPLPIPTTVPPSPSVESDGIQRIVVPKIDLDSNVVQVYWQEIPDDQGNPQLVWQVAQYAVGHHYTSAVPGQQSNIVLSAHVGGFGKLFRRLDEITPGDRIFLYQNNVQYTYQATESILLNEATASPVEQIENVSYINQTNFEVLTLITCWPPTGPDRFSQRLIVRALPVSGD